MAEENAQGEREQHLSVLLTPWLNSFEAVSSVTEVTPYLEDRIKHYGSRAILHVRSKSISGLIDTMLECMDDLNCSDEERDIAAWVAWSAADGLQRKDVCKRCEQSLTERISGQAHQYAIMYLIEGNKFLANRKYNEAEERFILVANASAYLSGYIGLVYTAAMMLLNVELQAGDLPSALIVSREIAANPQTPPVMRNYAHQCRVAVASLLSCDQIDPNDLDESPPCPGNYVFAEGLLAGTLLAIRAGQGRIALALIERALNAEGRDPAVGLVGNWLATIAAVSCGKFKTASSYAAKLLFDGGMSVRDKLTAKLLRVFVHWGGGDSKGAREQLDGLAECGDDEDLTEVREYLSKTLPSDIDDEKPAE